MLPEPEIASIEWSLSPYEMAATIEALHDAVLRRLKWTVQRERKHWSQLDWEVVTEVVNQAAQAYSKAVMTLRSLDDLHVNPKFYEAFEIPTEGWDLINDIFLADSWDEAPVHDPCDCRLCFKMAHA